MSLEAEMKKFVIAGTVAAAIAVGATALAQQPAQTTPPAPAPKAKPAAPKIEKAPPGAKDKYKN